MLYPREKIYLSVNTQGNRLFSFIPSFEFHCILLLTKHKQSVGLFTLRLFYTFILLGIREVCVSV